MTSMTGAEYLARTLEAYGVETVFYVPNILSRSLYEMERHTGIKRVVTHGETPAAFMADAYARVLGKPGVCFAQHVGVLHLAAGLREPFLATTPVVAMSGGKYPTTQARRTYQQLDEPVFSAVTKFSSVVPDPSRLPDLLAYAFQEATAGKPGPTHLEVAGHSGELTENGELDAEIPDGPAARVPAYRSLADPAAVAAAAEQLRRASRPVIVAGGGVRISGAGAELLALAERVGAPVATSMNGKDTIPGNHPLAIGVPGSYSRLCANQVLLESDLVIYVGSQTGSQVTLSWKVPPLDRPVIQIDIEASEVGRHYHHVTGLLADAKAALGQLLEATTDITPEPRRAWLERAATLVRAWREDTREVRESEHAPVRPERLCQELTDHLPEDAILLSDTGHAGMWTGGFVDLNAPGQSYLRAAGSLGWGLPASIGAKLAAPDRPVVLFTGDGGLWYHLSELETAARWRVPVVVVVNNNQSLNQETDVYARAYGGELHGRHAELWHFSDVSFETIAQSMGVRGFTVNKPSEFASTLEAALEHAGPTLIDVRSDIGALAPVGSAEPAGPPGY